MNENGKRFYRTFGEGEPGIDIDKFIKGFKEYKKNREKANNPIKMDNNKKCKHCEFLYQIFGKTEKLNPKEYWLFTEIFVYLHGSDECNLK